MKITRLLSDSFLFKGIDEGELTALLNHSPPTVRSFKKGEKIYSSDSGGGLVGFVLSGEIEVLRERGDGSHVLLNTLSVSDSFGILSVFSEEEYPTSVFAARASEVLFFSAEQIKRFVGSSSVITMNLINFMADRIAFLNRKIATFSASSVEARLSALLICESKRRSSLTLPFSYVKIGEEINAGRASVYRAVGSLESVGLIEVKNKTVQIIDPQGLERINK